MRARAVPLSRYFVFVAIAATGLSLDLGTKHWAFTSIGMPGEGRMPIFGETLVLETSLNEGALFGMGQGFSVWFGALTIVALTGLLCWLFLAGAARYWLLTIALGGVVAGMLGNLYDRFGFAGLTWNYPPERIGESVYAVRDWVHFHWQGVIDWPLFNVADSLLVGGAGLLILHSLLTPARPENEPVRESTARPSQAA